MLKYLVGGVLKNVFIPPKIGKSSCLYKTIENLFDLCKINKTCTCFKISFLNISYKWGKCL